jgi:hypothetical protein
MKPTRHYHQLKKPCGNCPFRKEGAIELREGRLSGIINDLEKDDFHSFPCHKTVTASDYQEEDDLDAVDTQIDDKAQMCAGAAIYLLKQQLPTVSMRVASSFGILNFDDLMKHSELVIDSPPKASKRVRRNRD